MFAEGSSEVAHPRQESQHGAPTVNLPKSQGAWLVSVGDHVLARTSLCLVLAAGGQATDKQQQRRNMCSRC